ncbi:hypothetical protein GCM10012275_59410 [Longimycelium tulufanense]|uniref:Uncharacterized protein n=1 Tax=Longimycelium tulufanense TaxID=907463 RepID=A0A8J3CIH3_9PSEU|nr:hypothetical protein [Longimycelium tulufanense]GGM80899.1 hypothetical protein GCM10012275_59410 [Longimycelium tulufanense]
MFVLSLNGEMISTDVDNDSSIITVENADDTMWQCAACGGALSEEPDGYADESGSQICDAYDPYDDPEVDDIDTAPDFREGPHRAERVPLSWANSAAIHTDPAEDSITVTVSVGDPRGAFAFTLRRIPDDAPTNGGRLIMHTPYPGQPLPHADLTEDHTGTYWVG